MIVIIITLIGITINITIIVIINNIKSFTISPPSSVSWLQLRSILVTVVLHITMTIALPNVAYIACIAYIAYIGDVKSSCRLHLRVRRSRTASQEAKPNLTSIRIGGSPTEVLSECEHLFEERLKPWMALSSEIALRSGTAPSSSIRFNDRLIS